MSGDAVCPAAFVVVVEDIVVNRKSMLGRMRMETSDLLCCQFQFKVTSQTGRQGTPSVLGTREGGKQYYITTHHRQTFTDRKAVLSTGYLHVNFSTG